MSDAVTDDGVGVAVIGAGHWGPNHIRTFAGLAGGRLAAVCDLEPARLAAVSARYPRTRTTTALAEVLAAPDVDAVVVATPAETHRAVAEASLRAGKHVLVEKPLAVDSRDAEAIVRAADAAGRVLMVGHLFLYDRAITRLVDLVRGGAIGEIRYAHGVRTSMAGTARLDTNVVWDAAVHDAYLLPALFGGPVRRVQVVGRAYLSPGLEDVAFVTFDFGDGALAHVYVSWYALEKARNLTVVGSEAILAYDDLAEPRLALHRKRYRASPERDPRGRRRWAWEDEGGQALEVEAAPPLRDECRHFLECVAAGRRPRTDGRAGLETVRILEACQRSLARDGQWVEVI